MCVRCVPSGRKGEILPFPPTLAIFAPLLFPSFSYVYVCMCIYCSRVLSLLAFRSPRSLADEFSTARQCATSCVILPRVPRFPMDILSYESASCYLLGPPGTLPFYMPLMSILRLAVFLSLWSLKDRWKRLRQFVIRGAVWNAKRKGS